MTRIPFLTDLENHRVDKHLQPIEDPSKTNPIRLRAIQHAEEERRMQISQLATEHMRATQPSMRVVPVTRPLLPLDKHGRPFYALYDSTKPTIQLIKLAVQQYLNYMNEYPAVILLSPIRYLGKGYITQYCIDFLDVTIPILFEGTTFLQMHQSFDVLVRGK